MVGTKMEFNSISDDKKATVLEKLKLLNSTDRMLLLNKYSRQTENIYCTFRAEEEHRYHYQDIYAQVQQGCSG